MLNVAPSLIISPVLANRLGVEPLEPVSLTSREFAVGLAGRATTSSTTVQSGGGESSLGIDCMHDSRAAASVLDGVVVGNDPVELEMDSFPGPVSCVVGLRVDVEDAVHPAITSAVVARAAAQLQPRRLRASQVAVTFVPVRRHDRGPSHAAAQPGDGYPPFRAG